MKIGLMGAMDEEIGLFIANMGKGNVQEAAGFRFHLGKLGSREIVVVKSGVGKVNAGVCAQLLISRFSVSAVIFTGVAGAINPALSRGDVVVGRDSVQHDMDATALKFKKGRIPFTDLHYFKASEHLASLASAAGKTLGLKTVEGRVLTGDQFISDSSRRSALREEFKGDCVDMEGAAVAHVCSLHGIPHVIIRSISDSADSSAADDFSDFLKAAAKNSYSIASSIISNFEIKSPDAEYAEIRESIRTIPDWPKKGVMFRDITTLLKDERKFSRVVELLAERYSCEEIDLVLGIEARGLIIGAALAHKLGKGFVPARKAGKLPAKTVSAGYGLEYGQDRIEIHEDAIKPGDRVLLVDDLVATGGTALAACSLVKKLGGTVAECCFVIGLPDLGGKRKLEEAGFSGFCLVEFEGG